MVQGTIPPYVNETRSLLNSIRIETAVSNLPKIDIPKYDIPRIDIDMPKTIALPKIDTPRINLGINTSTESDNFNVSENVDDDNQE